MLALTLINLKRTKENILLNLWRENILFYILLTFYFSSSSLHSSSYICICSNLPVTSLDTSNQCANAVQPITMCDVIRKWAGPRADLTGRAHLAQYHYLQVQSISPLANNSFASSLGELTNTSAELQPHSN